MRKRATALGPVVFSIHLCIIGVQAGEVETPAMAAEAGRETRRGAESDEESDGCK